MEELYIEEDKYRVPQVAESPWLITTHSHRKRNKLEKQTFATNTTSYVKTIPELHGNIILCATQGWLILRDRNDFKIYYVWNPVTSRLICLPELIKEDGRQPSACVLTSSPDHVDTDRTCVLVLFFEGGLVFSCRPTVSRNCCWVKHSLEIDGNTVDIQKADVHEGVIYAYAYTHATEGDGCFSHFVLLNVVASDSPDSDYSITLTEPTSLGLPDEKIKFHDHRARIQVVECCGVLYYICIRSYAEEENIFMDIINVMVWRLNLSQMEWIKVESLRNLAIFIDGNSCTWCSAPRPSIEENCIYIWKNSRLYSYKLRDDSYAIVSYPSSLPGPAYLEFSNHHIWFIPPTYQSVSLKMDGSSRINEKTQNFQEFVDDIHESPAQSRLLDLPTHTLQLISRHMNMFDCMNLGATCKTLYDANLVAEWRANCSYPLFMVRKDNKGSNELLDPFDNMTHTISTYDDSSIDLSTFESCKDGWVLLRSKGDYLKLLNPFSRTKIDDFPPCELPCAGFGFSIGPITEIVGIYGYERVTIARFESEIGDWLWHHMEDTDIPFYPNHKSTPRFHKNAFYFIGTDGCLGVLKTNQGNLRWQVYKSPFNDGHALYIDSCYLVDLNGEIASVFIGHMGSWIRVFKFDNLNKCWVELDTLGDHVVFVSRPSSFSIKTIKNEMKNRIYLPRRMGNDIVFYSLNTGKYHTSSSAKSMHNFLDMKAQLSCCWVY